MKKIYFDMDNTCIKTHRIYKEANEKNAYFIKNTLQLKETIDEIISIFNDIDISKIGTLGFAPERFILSWVEAYEYLAKKESILIKKSHTDEVRENANSVFKAKIEPFDDTHETLKHLQKAGYVLNLLTLGDQKVQQKRIKDANLAQYFQDIHIVPEKSTEALEKLLSNKNEKPESLIMVGDSLKGDIKPALDLGMKAYHMKQENWVFDIADVDFNHKNYTGIQKISDLLNHLA